MFVSKMTDNVGGVWLYIWQVILWKLWTECALTCCWFFCLFVFLWNLKTCLGGLVRNEFFLNLNWLYQVPYNLIICHISIYWIKRQMESRHIITWHKLQVIPVVEMYRTSPLIVTDCHFSPIQSHINNVLVVTPVTNMF